MADVFLKRTQKGKGREERERGGEREGERGREIGICLGMKDGQMTKASKVLFTSTLTHA